MRAGRRVEGVRERGFVGGGRILEVDWIVQNRLQKTLLRLGGCKSDTDVHVQCRAASH